MFTFKAIYVNIIIIVEASFLKGIVPLPNKIRFAVIMLCCLTKICF